MGKHEMGLRCPDTVPDGEAPNGTLAKVTGRINGAIAATEEFFAVAFFYLMLVGFLIQIFARFIIHYPLPWSEELCRHLFVWMGAFGTSIGVRWGAHFVAFDLQQKLAGWPKRIVIAAVKISVGLVAAVLLVQGLQFTREGFGQLTPILNIPTAIPNAAVPLAAALILWHLAYTWAFGMSAGGLEDMLGLEAKDA